MCSRSSASAFRARSGLPDARASSSVVTATPSPFSTRRVWSSDMAHRIGDMAGRRDNPGSKRWRASWRSVAR